MNQVNEVEKTIEIFIMGLGGDGALTCGELIANAAILSGKKASMYPFYGSQMRGGEANAVVKISSENIINPTLANPNYLVLLNDKYKDKYDDFLSDENVVVIKKEEENKNANIILYKKLISKIDFISAENATKSLRLKFKKDDVYNKILEVFNAN